MSYTSTQLLSMFVWMEMATAAATGSSMMRSTSRLTKLAALRMHLRCVSLKFAGTVITAFVYLSFVAFSAN